ncbi:hypothetical protein ELZ19_06945 [Brucella abortus]|uniref:hypothetical protein n=1 Tax=Brucella abortus TaxID=235 RepID=UPI0004E88DEA|nr:hypothetical protein [Brucella abortus]KFH18459.1 hypothetical protein IB60_17300 [Brucella abortus LMN1]RUQ67307.1 hypothetical protein ELZ23_15375 [Brucella abortus]RUQ78562.1 hypothetical protein ELZ22_16950 [Brucella abortus]RUQ88304.1 hypothetical protein ELZ18_15705 [Brucella abortus]RUQ90334.1 hypothetical protein ELZ20_15705 [Brucella abortus]
MQVAEGLEWLHIYWVRGDVPKNMRATYRYEVKDPPCSGWQHAFVIRGEKRSTIFCPYSFDAHTVRNDCAELMGAVEPKGDFRLEFMLGLMRKNWDEMQGRGWIKDYDTAALVFRRLGSEVPLQVMRGGEEDTRKKGGKDVANTLEKPVKLSGKRGKFLLWFLEGGGSRSVREAMAEFSMSRSNALSYLFMLRKDHGIGYELVGDVATVMLPEGCSNPFDEPWEGPDGAPASETRAEDEDDSWLEGDDGGKEDDDSWLD